MEVGRSPESQPENGATPTVACLRCRDQKLRCDRRLPSCTRCHKRKVVCTYPPPPDRKRIAQTANQSRTARLSALQRPHQYESSAAAAQSAKTPRSGNDVKEDYTPTVEDAGTADLPSTEVGLLLLEVYFKRIYNATLLFHKTTGFQLYVQNELPGHFLRAAFAHAAVFLKEVESPYKQYIKILPVQTLFEKSWPWARAASREVLSHADEPTLYRIQTLQVLQLYYFSQGETQRATIHASLAYQQCQLLGYDKLYENLATSSANRGWQIFCEMRRRCFWGTWCTSCIGNGRPDYSKACESVIGLPLPAKFEKGGSARGTVMKPGAKMDANWELSVKSALDLEMLDSDSGSLMAELIKLLGIWSKVQAFNSEPSMRFDYERMNQFNKLAELFKPIERSLQLPLTDIVSRAAIYDESPELLMSVCSVYYLNQLSLYISMVPVLSGSTRSPAPGESVRENADMALKEAIAFSELLLQFVANDLDITRLAPFSAYAAFMAGIVLLARENIRQFALSADQLARTPSPYSEEIKNIQMVLEVLSIYWKPLRVLSTKFNEAMEADQFKNPELLSAPAYPWNTHHYGGLPENYSNSKTFNPDVQRFPTPHESYSREGQTTDQHDSGKESHQLSEQMEPSERVHLGFQSPSSASNNTWELFDVAVQVGDTVPSLHIWDSQYNNIAFSRDSMH